MKQFTIIVFEFLFCVVIGYILGLTYLYAKGGF